MSLPLWNRRHLLAAGSASSFVGLMGAQARFTDRLTALEAEISGRIGLYATAVGSAKVLAHRADERFAMCSTFKALLAGFVLDDVAKGTLSASQAMRTDNVPLISYSPVVKARLEKGVPYMSVLGLCEAVVVISDNTAANILLDVIGGPSGFTRRVQKILGSDALRLDRYEPELNENKPGDPRDTTTPQAMASVLQQVLFGEAINRLAAQQMRAYMIDCATGLNRLRGGMPSTIVVGDKTGTSLNGLFGDNAFVLNTDGSPRLIVSCYVDAPGLGFPEGSDVHRRVGVLLTEEFGLTT